MYDVRLPRSVVIPSFSLYMANDQTEDLNWIIIWIIAKAAAKPSAGKSSKAKKLSTVPKVTTVEQLTGKRGTLKRRRQLQQLIEHFQQQADNDLFTSTPFRSNNQVLTVSVSSLLLSQYLRECQTNDKVGRLLWAWFSCLTKSADKIGEPWHTVNIFVCYFVRY